MSLRKTIKQNAKAALRGNLGRAIGIMLLIVAISMVIYTADSALFNLMGYHITWGPGGQLQFGPGALSVPSIGVSLLATLLQILLLVPLGLGVTNWYLDQTESKKRPVLHIFWPFENRAYFRSIGLYLNLLVKIFLYSFLYLLPLGLLGYAVSLLPRGWVSSLDMATFSLITALFFVLLLAISLLFSVFLNRYRLAPMLLCDQYRLSVHQAIKQSVRYTKGHRWELFWFDLSFLPWFLLSLLILPAFYVYPYYQMANIVYCRYLYEAGLRKDGFWTEPDAGGQAESVQRAETAVLPYDQDAEPNAEPGAEAEARPQLDAEES